METREGGREESRNGGKKIKGNIRRSVHSAEGGERRGLEERSVNLARKEKRGKRRKTRSRYSEDSSVLTEAAHEASGIHWRLVSDCLGITDKLCHFCYFFSMANMHSEIGCFLVCQ